MMTTVQWWWHIPASCHLHCRCYHFRSGSGVPDLWCGHRPFHVVEKPRALLEGCMFICMGKFPNTCFVFKIASLLKLHVENIELLNIFPLGRKPMSIVFVVNLWKKKHLIVYSNCVFVWICIFEKIAFLICISNWEETHEHKLLVSSTCEHCLFSLFVLLILYVSKSIIKKKTVFVRLGGKQWAYVFFWCQAVRIDFVQKFFLF